ncbi:PIN domain-containing protein [Candidatus Peregrinibacteria bacterium]|jgi:predicted nucleic acid-binding protein|nr:PIN domain-containing protein [Candidatus Peregrinibacteria bacterium]MBT7703065.1 PIN domain-containing protein [Candidatus Peregrinibacteria bacterium]
MPKTITIDSSVFVSSFLETDPNYKISRDFINKITKENIPILIPLTTFMEVLHACHRAFNDLTKTDQLYKKMIEWNLTRQIRFLNIEAQELVYFTAHHHRFKLKTADAIVALTAHRLKCPLITWDKQLLNVSSEIETLTPEKFLQTK